MRISRCIAFEISLLFVAWSLHHTAVAGAQERPRLRDLGISIGRLSPGPLNAITDVAGVRVGHTTLIAGDNVRTGVTAILPHGDNLFREKVRAGVFVANAFGKAAGLLQVQELGTIETPILLTNTLSVGTAMNAVSRWTLGQHSNASVRSVNAVVGETNDGFLNDIRGMHVTEADVIAAIQSASDERVAEGSVGAGTGTMALGYKGGIGTASRRLANDFGGYTVGALVQSNFGGELTIRGIPVAETIRQLDSTDSPSDPPTPAESGSIMIVLATDAPLTERNLDRLAFRAVGGLARSGASLSNGSGDFVIAFSTFNRVSDQPETTTAIVEELHNNFTSALFQAAQEAVEEAILNSILTATTVDGFQGRRGEAIPIERLVDAIQQTQPGLIQPANQ